jgi:serine/threonine protein kinase
MTITYQSHLDGVIAVTDSGKRYTLSNSNYLGGGKDGEVFRLDDEYAAKIYTENPIPHSLHEKLTILSNQKKKFHDSAVSPKEVLRLEGQSATDASGFIMKYLPEAKPLDHLKWNPAIDAKDEPVFDQALATFIYDISDALENLHSNRVFVGDLKPDNIMVSGMKAYIVDFDACSLLPDYPGNSFTIQYVDPRLREGIPAGRGPYEFSAGSDWWALAVIAFELFMGVSPWSGIHPNFRKDPLAFRSYNYSAVLFDDMVRPPAKYLRGRDWLDSKPRIKNFFRGIFSKNPASRVPIAEVLDGYFPRDQFAEESARVISRVESLLLSDRERLFIERPINDLQEQALKKAVKRDQARIQLLDMMYVMGSAEQKQ